MKSAIEAAETMPVSPEEAWSEIERELSVRRRCYTDWINAGKISWADARDRFARLRAAGQALKQMIEDRDATTPDGTKPAE